MLNKEYFHLSPLQIVKNTHTMYLQFTHRQFGCEKFLVERSSITFSKHALFEMEDCQQLNSAMILGCYEKLIWLKDSHLEDILLEWRFNTFQCFQFSKQFLIHFPLSFWKSNMKRSYHVPLYLMRLYWTEFVLWINRWTCSLEYEWCSFLETILINYLNILLYNIDTCTTT